MKLKALCALAAATLCLSLRAATALDDEPLLPEVQALLLQSKVPDTATLGQDVYVAMHALKAPANADYQSIAARIVQDNYSVYQQLLKATQAETSISGIPGEDPRQYYREDEALPVLYTSSDFPCRNLYAHNCVEEILEQRSSIKKISTESSPLMQRYLQLTEMPYYSHYFYPVMESNWPNYGVMVSTSFLRLANATLDLEDDKTEQVLKIMDGEITFSRRMLVSEHSLIGQMVAVARLYPQLHYVSALMDRPEWRAHLRKAPVAAWIAPLNADELHGFEATFQTELQFGLFQMYTLRKKGTDGNFHPLHDKLSDDDISRHYLRNTTLNIYYRVFQPLLRQTTIKSPQQAWKNLPSLEKEIASVVDTEIQKKGDSEKIRTSLALTEGFPDNYLSYLERYYDLQVYMALIRAKYALLQAGVNTGNARAVRAFLEHNEPATLNPFTQEPFEWDEAQHLLSAPWISTQTPSAYKPGDATPQTHMSVYIP